MSLCEAVKGGLNAVEKQGTLHLVTKFAQHFITNLKLFKTEKLKEQKARAKEEGAM